MKKNRPCLVCGKPYLTTVDWRIHPSCKDKAGPFVHERPDWVVGKRASNGRHFKKEQEADELPWDKLFEVYK